MSGRVKTRTDVGRRGEGWVRADSSPGLRSGSSTSAC